MEQILTKIRKELQDNIDLEYKEGATNFFKENVRIIGVRIPTVRRISGKYFKETKNLNKKEIFKLCEKLFKSGTNEEETIATDWCFKIKNNYMKKDFKIFESWIDNYISNWASCDGFCTHNIGYFIIRFPEFIHKLKEWTKSGNRWLKRASAVSFIYPAKKKKYIKDILEIADLLLTDNDDMVQKGYGWMLKEASKYHRKEVFDYVMKNKNMMPRTALRYAIEKMPEELRLKAMNK